MTVSPMHSTKASYIRRDGRWADLERLRTSSPMYDATIEEIAGRRIRVGQHWLSDFASCNYLGFDLEPEIMDAVDPYIRTWGTHPSWSRLLGNPGRTSRSRSASPSCSAPPTRCCCRRSRTSTCR